MMQKLILQMSSVRIKFDGSDQSQPLYYLQDPTSPPRSRALVSSWPARLASRCCRGKSSKEERGSAIAHTSKRHDSRAHASRERERERRPRLPKRFPSVVGRGDSTAGQLHPVLFLDLTVIIAKRVEISTLRGAGGVWGVRSQELHLGSALFSLLSLLNKKAYVYRGQKFVCFKVILSLLYLYHMCIFN